LKQRTERSYNNIIHGKFNQQKTMQKNNSNNKNLLTTIKLKKAYYLVDRLQDIQPAFK